MLKARLNKQEVEQTYSQTAKVYDIWGHLTESNARKLALQVADIQDRETILEVAMGTGLTFREILKANPNGKNFGIDLTEAMLAKAHPKLQDTPAKHYEIAVGDAYQLQFENERFDLLVNNYMFDLLPEEDFVTILQEFKRVLKPNGRLLLVNMTHGERFYQHFWELVYQINPRWMGGCRGVKASKALHKVGFKGIQRHFISQFGFPSEILMAYQTD